MMWGRRKENGVWLSEVSRRRVMWRGHDSLFVAFGRLRLRIMKPRLGRRSRRDPAGGGVC